MPCLGPLTAYYSKVVNPSGKRSLVFRASDSFSGVPISVPCSQCVECRLDHARQWAIRLMKENQCHETSSFITLTYDDSHLPDGKTLVRSHVQAFHKRLHNRLLRSRGYGIRFYYSGEYGETFGRPHYHSIIFGFDFPDKKFYKRNHRDEPIYKSDYLRELWPFGDNGIGLVTFESAAYVAGYVVSKISVGHDEASEARFNDRYLRSDSEGRPFLLEREFSGMSNRPGIGHNWFQRFHKETYRDDSVVIGGIAVRPPRYFDNLFEGIDAKRLKRLKSVRRRRAMLQDHSSRRSFARERIVKARLNLRRKDVT